MPRPFYPGKDPVPILQEGGWVQGPVWTLLKNTVEKRPLHRLGCKCKDNIKMVVRSNSYYQSKRRYFPKDLSLVKNGS
jgi:hypothetical protein